MRDTRHELLMEAELLVRARGYASFSYAQLAEVVGIRKASIHYYFRTKDDLATALVAAYDARYDAALSDIRASSDDGLARIAAYGQLYLDGVGKRLSCLCAVLATEIDLLPESLRADIAKFFAKHLAWVEGVLRDGQGNGTIAAHVDCAAGARMVIATLEGALMLERVMAGPAGFKSTLHALTESFRPR